MTPEISLCSQDKPPKISLPFLKTLCDVICTQAFGHLYLVPVDSLAQWSIVSSTVTSQPEGLYV